MSKSPKDSKEFANNLLNNIIKEAKAEEGDVTEDSSPEIPNDMTTVDIGGGVRIHVVGMDPFGKELPEYDGPPMSSEDKWERIKRHVDGSVPTVAEATRIMKNAKNIPADEAQKFFDQVLFYALFMRPMIVAIRDFYERMSAVAAQVADDHIDDNHVVGKAEELVTDFLAIDCMIENWKMNMWGAMALMSTEEPDPEKYRVYLEPFCNISSDGVEEQVTEENITELTILLAFQIHETVTIISSVMLSKIWLMFGGWNPKVMASFDVFNSISGGPSLLKNGGLFGAMVAYVSDNHQEGIRNAGYIGENHIIAMEDEKREGNQDEQAN